MKFLKPKTHEVVNSGMINSEQNSSQPCNKSSPTSNEELDASSVCSVSASRHHNNNGYVNPWVLKQVSPASRRQATPKLTRLNKQGTQNLKSKSSLLIPMPNDDDNKPGKVWRRSSWASGNPPPDAPRDQSREIELVLKGTVPVKKPPSNPTILLTVPATKVRPRSENMS